MSPQDSQEVDTQILQNANQLIRQLQVSDFKPTRVSWVDYIIAGRGTFTGPHIRLVRPGWPVFTWDEVVLPGDLKGKLAPEDWRPLLAPPLIYAGKQKLKKTVGLAASVVATILLDTALVAILGVFDPSAVISAAIPLFFASIVLLLMGIPFVNPLLKSLRLQADRLAAQLVGKDPLLRVLDKINNLELKDKDIGGRQSRWPSLEERIQALKQI